MCNSSFNYFGFLETAIDRLDLFWKSHFTTDPYAGIIFLISGFAIAIIPHNRNV